MKTMRGGGAEFWVARAKMKNLKRSLVLVGIIAIPFGLVLSAASINLLIPGNGSKNVLDLLMAGDIKSVKLMYQSTDSQIIRTGNIVYIVKPATVTLIAVYDKQDGKIRTRLSLQIEGKASVMSEGTPITIDNYCQNNSLELNYQNGSYFHDGTRIGVLPILSHSEEEMPLMSVYLLEKGESITTYSRKELVDIKATEPISLIMKINPYSHSATMTLPTGETINYNTVPPVYEEIAKLSGSNKLTFLLYKNNSPKIAFAVKPIVEEKTGISLSFQLIGAPETLEDSVLVYDDEEFDCYPISSISIALFNTLVPKSFFELKSLEIERARFVLLFTII